MKPARVAVLPAARWWRAGAVVASAAFFFVKAEAGQRIEMPDPTGSAIRGEGARGLCPAVKTMRVQGIEFAFREPARVKEDARILVLFGGRGWPGSKSLAMFGFEGLADRRGLFLLSPSFREGEYWEPSTGTGELLKRAVGRLEKEYGLKEQAFYLYGFSAGGQCAALFAAFLGEKVAAWGAHACGVFPERERLSSTPVPALLTCGREDAGRDALTRRFGYVYREKGGLLLRQTFSGGHELQPGALALARAWFEVILSGGRVAAFRDDDTGRVVPAARAREIDVAFRNPLYEGMGAMPGER